MTTLGDMAASLKASLLKSEDKFAPDDLQRLIQTAVTDYSRYRPLVSAAMLTLQAGVALYPCPADLTLVQGCDYGRDAKLARQPWDDSAPGRLPEMRVVYSGGARMLQLMPAPSARLLSLLGSSCSYRYQAAHQIDANGTTLQPHELPLVLLRAQVEALRELSISHTTLPYQVRDGISSTPRNGTPAFLHKVLHDMFLAEVTR